MSKLKIGLIVDSVWCSKYIKDLVEEIEGSKLIEIKAILIQEKSKKINFTERLKRAIKKKGAAYLLGKFFYLLVFWLEKYVIEKHKYFSEHLKCHEFIKNKNNIIYVKPDVSKSGFVYRYTEQDISTIESLKLDALIRCGSGILRGKILTSTKYGIISFHHGDNRKYRGSPAGFWEVLNEEPSTGFVIQRLTEELDGGDILFRGSFPTQSFYMLNQAMLYTKSNIYMKLLLEKIATEKTLHVIDQEIPYSRPLYREPNLYNTLLYLSYIIKSLWIKYLNRLIKKKSKWNVSYVQSGWNNVVLWKGKPIPNPNNHYLADPFVFSRDGIFYIFVEDFDLTINKGSIRLYCINEDEIFDLGVIVEEKFHLSFPYIFEFDGELYMCPETSEKNEIRLYKCVEFPGKWIFHSVAINNIRAVDSMIFKKDDRWWLFTNTDTSNVNEYCSELLIFFSDNPINGDWVPHKKNPVVVNSNVARNGGILSLESNLYRVAQRQGFLNYGESVSICKIVVLSADQYSEKECCILMAEFKKNVKGIHHMHCQNNITVYDYSNYA